MGGGSCKQCKQHANHIEGWELRWQTNCWQTQKQTSNQTQFQLCKSGVQDGQLTLTSRIWFDAWEKDLHNLGFGTVGVDGDLNIPNDQLLQIIDIDKTVLTETMVGVADVQPWCSLTLDCQSQPNKLQNQAPQ